MTSFTFEAEIWKWSGEKSSWYFVTLPKDTSFKIKRENNVRLGFGSIRVVAKIGQVQWKTSIFSSTKHNAYILPVKSNVRNRCDLGEGSVCSVYIELEPSFMVR
jgi:hypothetical protein